ncbi:MAG: DNA primase [Streptosporangiales bacterium]|nr:DNA primase [Streptosporangiales bacterium]
MLAAALEFAGRGWVVCPGARPRREGGGACSCDRLGCPAPAAHPISPAWQFQATADEGRVRAWWGDRPDANVVLPTGRVFDVLDVPAAGGVLALARLDRAGTPTGPIAAYGTDRYLFFVATRGAPEDEHEWWSSELDVTSSHTGALRTGAVHLIEGEPELVEAAPDLRWHCRDSYVVAPPSELPSGQQVYWVRRPDSRSLPDPLALLEVLADSV